METQPTYPSEAQRERETVGSGAELLKEYVSILEERQYLLLLVASGSLRHSSTPPKEVRIGREELAIVQAHLAYLKEQLEHLHLSWVHMSRHDLRELSIDAYQARE